MANISYFRKPLKLILYAFLLVLTTAAVLIFSLQYRLDGLSLEHAINSYAYIGTVFSRDSQNASMEPISQDVLRVIQGSSLVEAIDIRNTYAGKLTDTYTVPDFMITTDQVQQHYFVDATVVNEIKGAPQKGAIHYDSYTMRINRQWGSSSIVQASITLHYVRGAEEPKLEKGQRFFLIGSYIIMNNGVNSKYMQITTPQALQIQGQTESVQDNPLKMHPIHEIAADMNMVDAEAYIYERMEETGILPVYEIYTGLTQTVSVRTTQDFTMLPYYLKGRIYLDSGRPIYTSDAVQKVCLVSQGLSLRNRLKVGDRIELSVADGSYLYTVDESDTGWESGWPMVGEVSSVTYTEGEIYEIVGIYHQLSRNTEDPMYFSVNDIFIPTFENASSDVRPYAFSFRVTGPNYDAFLEEVEPQLEALGYELKIIDSHWDDVDETFYAMLDRQRIMLCCTVAAFVLSVSMFALLLYQNFKFEFGLMRLLGAYRREAGSWIFGGYLVIALPASVIAVLMAWSVYVLWLKDAANAVMNVAMPGNGECILMLFGLSAIQILAGLAGLSWLVVRGERRLLHMIR